MPVRLEPVAPLSRFMHSTTEPPLSLNVDLVNMNAYIKFGEILIIFSKDMERKRNLGVNQGP